MRALVLLLIATGVAAQETPKRGPVAVRVIGPTGAALPGIGVGDGKVEGKGKLLGRTDATGVLRLPDLPYDGTVFLSIHDDRLPGRLRITADGMEPFEVQGGRVVGPELEILAHGGVPAEVVFVDAETGKEIPGVKWAVDREPRAERRQLLFVGPGESAPLMLGKMPRGFVAWDRSGAVGAMSLYARATRAIVPLRRAIHLDLTILSHDGKPSELAEITSYETAGRRIRWRSDVDEKGVAELLGLPFFRGEPITVHVREEIDFDFMRVATWTGTLPDTHRLVFTSEVRLPKKTEPYEEDTDGRGGNTAIGISGGKPTPSAAFGTVTVRAVRHNGRPAAGTRVKLIHPKERDRHRHARMDERAEATLEKVGTGVWTVEVHGAGFLAVRKLIAVRPNSRQHFDLIEPTPGSADVEVVDSRGRPIPFARLELFRPDKKFWWGRSWDIDAAGVQRVDPFTDVTGRRTMHHLPPGKLGIRARYGSRKAEGVVDIEPQERARVKLVLR